jgi:ribonuclease HI
MSNPNDGPEGQWVRMRFRRNKVWAASDAAGRPIRQDGRTLIKYQLDQPHEYRVKTQDLEPLGEAQAPPEAPEAPEAPRRAPRKKTALPPGPVIAAAGDARCIHVYTDGASSGNPGPSGIGVVLRYGEQRREISEYIGEATNNIAELLAIQKGLAAVKKRSFPVRVYTDSKYALGVLSLNWKPKKNIELIAAIRKTMATFKDLRFIKVQGHCGVAENERADHLATSAVAREGR